jgi:hypothetical protein
MDMKAFSDRLHLLRAADPGYRVFGAAAHMYRLRPPATEDEVGAFEERHRVRLPDEYRDFLTGLGNGGAGPCYGLFPLGIFWDNPNPARQEGMIGDLARPFPHEDAWNAGADYWEMEPDIEVDEASWRAWRRLYFSRQLIDGALPICHEACGFFLLLIVTGADRGRIWLDGRASDDGIMPVTSGGRLPMTFGHWYANWLDEASRELGLPPLCVPPPS